MPPPELETPAGGVLPAIGGDPVVVEAEAWALVEAAWTDEEAHRAYLSRFADLEGLARAGGRYRAVLAARPGDPIAQRFRDEVVRRATAQGLALLPRTSRRAAPPIVRKLLVALCVALGSAAAWAVWKLAALVLRSPAP
jgi:hypothetical protein